MKKVPEEAHGVYEWPYQPNQKKNKHRTENSNRKNSKEKQSEEEMIRSLQGVFCKGRYRSWVFSHDRN